jgi:hypothetical protein
VIPLEMRADHVESAPSVIGEPKLTSAGGGMQRSFLRGLSILAFAAIVLIYYAHWHAVHHVPDRLPVHAPYMRSLYTRPIGTDLHEVSLAAATLQIAGRSDEAESLRAYYTACALRLVADLRDTCQTKSVRTAIDANLKQPVPPPPVALPKILEGAVQSTVAVSLLAGSAVDDATGPVPAQYMYKNESEWANRDKPDTRLFRAMVKNVGNLPIRRDLRLQLGLVSTRPFVGLIADCPEVIGSDDKVLLPGESISIFCCTAMHLRRVSITRTEIVAFSHSRASCSRTYLLKTEISPWG